MIAWNDYLNKLIEVPDTIDGIDVSFDEGKNRSSIPAIVKSSNYASVVNPFSNAAL